MKPTIKDYLHLTARERNGILVLILICIFFWGIPRWYQFIWHPEVPDYEAFEKLLACWERTTPAAADGGPEAVPVRRVKAKQGTPIPNVEQSLSPATAADTLFSFDPNELDEKDLRRLGLTQQVVRNLLKYRERGGVFRQKEDLRKIYGMTDAAYQRIAPYLDLPQALAGKMRRDTVVVDINKASPEEWARLSGIGPVLSQRIVRFREKLGGFASIRQVSETYGLPDSTFQKIEPHLVASPLFSFLPLNAGSVEELASHPYLNTRQARAIVAYRSNHGAFRSAADLVRVGVVDTTTFEKIRPYLDFSAVAESQ